ncbi:MAG: hypothetical protein JNL13_12800 [Chitinophagaceae bacterium]|nr:hypothetical protein [Chitinophagaceae bacterium]
MMFRFAFLILSFQLFCSRVEAQPFQLIRSVPLKAGILEVDELGNAYVVRKDNALIKFNESTDSVANYVSIANGEITDVDVTNPLRVMLYYAGFAKLVLLDRMLAPKNELNLRKLNQLNIQVIALSAEGNLWVYDQFTATLNKLDIELNYMVRGNDLRQQLDELPQPGYLTERDRRVYMVDTARGIHVFDQYGSYINTLPIRGVSKLQVVGTQLIYRKGAELISYDFSKFGETSMPIPEIAGADIVQAAYCRNVLYVLYSDRLVWYRTAN